MGEGSFSRSSVPCFLSFPTGLFTYTPAPLTPVRATPSMAQISFFKPQALVYPLQGSLRGHGTEEGSGSPGAPYMFSRGPSPGQLLDSVLGLGALGLTTWVILSTACPALLLLLLLVSFLAFDLLHR